MGDFMMKFPRKPTHNNTDPEDCIIFRGWDSAGAGDDSQSESEVCSPTLWGSNCRTSPQFHRPPRNRSLSPTARIRAIARGQQELMEMVRNMPESSYELSLKDLVEKNPGGSVEKYDSGSESSGKRRSETRALVARTSAVDRGGFYLKMFFPMPFRQIPTKKKSNLRTDSGLSGGGSRVSPKPQPRVDGEWWRKRSSEAAGENEGSVSGGSSNSSSSERSNSRNSETQGSCWFCISPMRSKNTE